MSDVLLPYSLKFPHINVREVRHSNATHAATTLSKTYKTDMIKRDTMIIRTNMDILEKLYTYITEEEKETWWNMHQKIMTYN
jgi:hypothetical protein